MSRRQKQIIVLITLFVAALVGARYWLGAPGPEKSPGQAGAPVDRAATASDAPEAEGGPGRPAGEAQLAVARRMAAERTAIEALPPAPPGPGLGDGQGYGTLDITVSGGARLGRFFDGLGRERAGTIAVTARLSLDDGRTLPAIPLLVLARGNEASADEDAAYRAVFGRDETAPPLEIPFRVDGATHLTVSFDATYSAQRGEALVTALKSAGGGVAEALAVAPSLWPPRARRALAARSRAFRDILAQHDSTWFAGLVTFTMDLRRPESPRGRRLAFRDATGTPLGGATVRLALVPSLLGPADPGPLDYRRAMALRIAAAGTIGDHFAANPAALARFLGAAGADLGAACRGLTAELRDGLGLSVFDTAHVLGALIRTHALFATGADYRGACLDPAMARIVAASGPIVPATPTPSAADIAALDAVVGRMVAGPGGKAPRQQSAKRRGAAFARAVVLRDRGGEWLAANDEAVVRDADTFIHPAAGPDEAAGAVARLPVTRFSCLSAGSGRRGIHRAALARIADDPALRILDVAFDGKGRITGVSLVRADQAQVCRAIAGAGADGNACELATPGRSPAGIDPAKC